MIADKLIAHRGWQRHYPENSLLALQQALNVGAKHIEIDIQLTADHIPVLCHDQVLSRLCGRDLNINHCQFKELEPLSCYEPDRLGEKFLGTPLSPLEDCVTLFSQHPKTTLYVEFKRQSIREFGAAAVLDASLPLLEKISKHCILISFDIDILQQAADRGWKHTAPVLTDLTQIQQAPIQTLAPSLIFCNEKLFNDKPLEDSQHFSKLPFAVAIYEIDSYTQACRLIKQGAAMIETFAIGELIDHDNNNRAENECDQ